MSAFVPIPPFQAYDHNVNDPRLSIIIFDGCESISCASHPCFSFTTAVWLPQQNGLRKENKLIGLHLHHVRLPHAEMVFRLQC